MPNSIEAEFLGVEMLLLEKSIKHYLTSITKSELEDAIVKRWSEDSLVKCNKAKKGDGATSPISIHKLY